MDTVDTGINNLLHYLDYFLLLATLRRGSSLYRTEEALGIPVAI